MLLKKSLVIIGETWSVCLRFLATEAIHDGSGPPTPGQAPTQMTLLPPVADNEVRAHQQPARTARQITGDFINGIDPEKTSLRAFSLTGRPASL